MAWSAPITWAGGQVPTAALLNAQLRDNLLESMPAKATEEGQFFVGNGVNSIIGRKPDAQRITTSQTRTTGTFGDLATVGPEVTVTHGSYAFVFWSCSMSSNVNEGISGMSYAVSGDNTIAATIAREASQESVPANNTWRIGGVHIHSNLTPGTSTFTAKYSGAGFGDTSTFADRVLGVIPF